MNKDDVNFMKRMLLKNEQVRILLENRMVYLIKDECKDCEKKETCWSSLFCFLIVGDDAYCVNKKKKVFIPEFQDSTGDG